MLGGIDLLEANPRRVRAIHDVLRPAHEAYAGKLVAR
jgi:hypothetical protein